MAGNSSHYWVNIFLVTRNNSPILRRNNLVENDFEYFFNTFVMYIFLNNVYSFQIYFQLSLMITSWLNLKRIFYLFICPFVIVKKMYIITCSTLWFKRMRYKDLDSHMLIFLKNSLYIIFLLTYPSCKGLLKLVIRHLYFALKIKKFFQITFGNVSYQFKIEW